MSTQNKTGVVLLTYGSATTALGVAAYLEHIHLGTSPGLVQEFERRYRLIGRSPLVEITRAQAAALERELGEGYVVRAGMQHSAPFITDAVAECKAAGVTKLVGIILSPQFSSAIMGGYATQFTNAALAHGFKNEEIRIAKPWPTEPHFVELLAERTRLALAELSKKYNQTIPVIFTTHSVPKRVVEKDAQYLEQLAATIAAVRAELDPSLEWRAAYQSAGHSPEPWLTPDLAETLAAFAAEKHSAVLIVPIQFLSDHLEILYDLDIAAKGQCEATGISYHRIELPNTDPRFIRALGSLARRAF